MTRSTQNQHQTHRTSTKRLQKILVTGIVVVITLVIATLVFNWAWKTNYHKNDLQDRPLNDSFIYIGRDLRTSDRNWISYVPGLRILGASPNSESLFYTTDASPESIAEALSGSWQLTGEYRENCSADRSDGRCTHITLTNENGDAATVKYLPYSALASISKERGFPLKSDRAEYFIAINEGSMIHIQPSNIDPKIMKINFPDSNLPQTSP